MITSELANSPIEFYDSPIEDDLEECFVESRFIKVDRERNNIVGDRLEVWKANIYRKIIGKRRLASGEYRIVRNPNKGEGVDFLIYRGNDLILVDEVKNWRDQQKPYGTEVTDRNVIPRFEPYEQVPNKHLTITFEKLFCKKGQRQLTEKNVETLEIGLFVDRQTWGQATGDFLTRYYHKLRIQLGIETPKPQPVPKTTQPTKPAQPNFCVIGSSLTGLDKYLDTTSKVTSKDKQPDNNELEHNTVDTETKEYLSYEQLVEETNLKVWTEIFREQKIWLGPSRLKPTDQG